MSACCFPDGKIMNMFHFYWPFISAFRAAKRNYPPGKTFRFFEGGISSSRHLHFNSFHGGCTLCLFDGARSVWFRTGLLRATRPNALLPFDETLTHTNFVTNLWIFYSLCRLKLAPSTIIHESIYLHFNALAYEYVIPLKQTDLFKSFHMYKPITTHQLFHSKTKFKFFIELGRKIIKTIWIVEILNLKYLLNNTTYYYHKGQ